MATTTSSNGSSSNEQPSQQQQQSNGVASDKKKQPLAVAYPVNSAWEFTLEPKEVVSGRVYCTDELSQIVVLQKALVHTTLASEIRMVNVATIVEAKALPDEEATDQVAPLSQPLPKVQKKALEERERRAIRLAEESFQHINQKVRTSSLECLLFPYAGHSFIVRSLTRYQYSLLLLKATPEGQVVFDRLLKACGVVTWKDESIVVLNQIQVDPPYSSDHCKIILQRKGSNSLEDGSLDRVKKIVSAASTVASP